MAKAKKKKPALKSKIKKTVKKKTKSAPKKARRKVVQKIKSKKAKTNSKSSKLKSKGKSRVKTKPSKTSPYQSLGEGRVRVLVAKAGLDGHDRGAKVIARALRDAGFEVVYTGLHQTPEMIVNAAIQEDVHVVGVSILSGAHNAVVPEIVKGIRDRGADDVLFLVGGIIPDEDISFLKKKGVDMVFTPGTSIESIVDYIQKNVRLRTL